MPKRHIVKVLTNQTATPSNNEQTSPVPTPFSGNVKRLCSQQEPCYVEQVPSSAPSPAWKKPEWVIVDVTLVYSILTGLMWLTIRKQAKLLKQQITDARKAADDSSKNASETLAAIKRQAKGIAKQADDMRTQTGILKDSVDAARKSAEAAKINADLALGASLPTLVIHELETGDVGAANAEAFFQYPRIKISIKNYGQTPAFLKWWSLCFTCEDLPEEPIYDGPANGMILDKIVVQPDTVYTFPRLSFPYRQRFSLEDVKAIVNREKIFHVYGYICYGDIFGNPLRRLKFCETVLNIFGDESICDWWEGLAPSAYTGTEQYPIKE